MTERQLMENVIELARLLHWSCYHTWMSIRSAAGFPDLVLCRPPRVLFIELKSERGTLTPQQARWLDLLRACPGVEVHCWRPSDWERIADVLR